MVIGRSNLFGKPMSALLLAANVPVTTAPSRTKDLPAVCRNADILVAADGRPGAVKVDWISASALLMPILERRFPDFLPRAQSITPSQVHGMVHWMNAYRSACGGRRTQESPPTREGFVGDVTCRFWLRGQDLNLRPSGYGPQDEELPSPAKMKSSRQRYRSGLCRKVLVAGAGFEPAAFRLWSAGRGATIASEDEVFAPAISLWSLSESFGCGGRI
ncbi:hypothetical protein LJR258_002906 [Rhizobium sp. LjRoot258]